MHAMQTPSTRLVDSTKTKEYPEGKWACGVLGQNDDKYGKTAEEAHKAWLSAQ